MPIRHTVDRKRRRIAAMAEGLVTHPEIVAHLRRERDEGILPLFELVDASTATTDLTPEEVRQIVDYLRELGRDSALGPVAVLVGSEMAYGMIRMLGIMGEDVCNIRPFRDQAEAERWLDSIAAARPPRGGTR